MIRFVKKYLLKIFGVKIYLKIISKVYIFLISKGYGKKHYPELFFLAKILKHGSYCIDIGANVGYYSFFMSKYIGENGKLIAIEPIKLFADIWHKNMKTTRNKNFKLLNIALGETQKSVSMGTPVFNGILHHGMTKIINDNESNILFKTEVEMKIPDEVFSEMEKLDFIKIDVEGYESIVLQNMKNVISKHKPLIQAELSGKQNREVVIKFLKELSYTVNILDNNKLIEITNDKIETYQNDFYFVPDLH
jgi:FkbM family methyltransferase